MCDWGQFSPAMGIKETNFLGLSHLYPIFCENIKTSFLPASFIFLESLFKKNTFKIALFYAKNNTRRIIHAARGVITEIFFPKGKLNFW